MTFLWSISNSLSTSASEISCRIKVGIGLNNGFLQYFVEEPIAQINYDEINNQWHILPKRPRLTVVVRASDRADGMAGKTTLYISALTSVIFLGFSNATRTFIVLGSGTSWIVEVLPHYICLLLISMLWYRQAIFESKGDKLSSSAECRIRTQGLRHLFASRLNACWQTDWAIEDQAKKLELDSPSLWSASIQPTRPHCQLAFAPGSGNIHVCC